MRLITSVILLFILLPAVGCHKTVPVVPPPPFSEKEQLFAGKWYLVRVVDSTYNLNDSNHAPTITVTTTQYNDTGRNIFFSQNLVANVTNVQYTMHNNATPRIFLENNSCILAVKGSSYWIAPDFGTDSTAAINYTYSYQPVFCFFKGNELELRSWEQNYQLPFWYHSLISTYRR